MAAMSPSRNLTPGLLAARSGVATIEIVGFSAFAHRHAAGHLPPADQLVWIALAVLGGTALMLLGRLRVRSLVVATTLLQFGLHFAYQALASAPSHHGGPVGHVTSVDLMPSTEMVLAHLVAAGVAALVLVGQEQAVRMLADLVEIVLAQVPATAELRRPVVRLLSVRLTSVRTTPRRGPPALLPA